MNEVCDGWQLGSSNINGRVAVGYSSFIAKCTGPSITLSTNFK